MTFHDDVIEVVIAHAKIIVQNAENMKNEKHNTHIQFEIFQRNSEYICFYS